MPALEGQVERLVWENQRGKQEGGATTTTMTMAGTMDGGGGGVGLAKVRTASTLNHNGSTGSMQATRSDGGSNGKAMGVVKGNKTPAIGSKSYRRVKSPSVIVSQINLNGPS